MALTQRLRRLRQHEKIRDLVRETTFSRKDLIYPLFIKHGLRENKPINSMPGQYQLSIDKLAAECDIIQNLDIPAVILFGIPAEKDLVGSDSYSEEGIIAKAIQTIKRATPGLLVIADTCFCEYTSHGHCGIINKNTGKADLDNDATLEILAKQALCQAQMGADVIAPSGMIDGMVRAIRNILDKNNFQHIPILSYSDKFASSHYGPFREAAEGAPSFGDRRTYQMDPANKHEALREAALDIEEGADMLMVKPALPYLDIIHMIKQQYPYMPMAAYQVSGEYSMIKAAAQAGWLDEPKIVFETLTSIKRAGADCIISYFAKDVAKWLS